MSGRITVAAVQMDPTECDPAGNLERVRQICMGQHGSDLIVLPETWSTGYQLHDAVRCAHKNLEVLAGLQELAANAEVAIAGSLIMPQSAGMLPINEATLVDAKGDVCARYSKSHLIDAYSEKEYFSAGRTAQASGWNGIRFGLAICYDLRFPELFRSYARQGAELLVICSEWPRARVGYWTLLVRARAVENQAYVVACNRVGRDAATTYAGTSLVVSPTGEVLAEGSPDRPDVVRCALSFDALRQTREAFPVLKDAWLINE